MTLSTYFELNIFLNRIHKSIQLTKVVEFCEMNEAIYDLCVEKEYLAWFRFIQAEDKVLCQLNISAWEF